MSEACHQMVIDQTCSLHQYIHSCGSYKSKPSSHQLIAECLRLWCFYWNLLGELVVAHHWLVVNKTPKEICQRATLFFYLQTCKYCIRSYCPHEIIWLFLVHVHLLYVQKTQQTSLQKKVQYDLRLTSRTRLALSMAPLTLASGIRILGLAIKVAIFFSLNFATAAASKPANASLHRKFDNKQQFEHLIWNRDFYPKKWNLPFWFKLCHHYYYSCCIKIWKFPPCTKSCQERKNLS